jgi:hypothetical protein
MRITSTAERSTMSPIPLYSSFSFLLNAVCAAALLLGSIWLIVKRWNIIPSDTITGIAFWVGLIAITGPFIGYLRTYSELRVLNQMDAGSSIAQVPNLVNAMQVARRALDNQMLQYFAVMFTLLLCIARGFEHR